MKHYKLKIMYSICDYLVLCLKGFTCLIHTYFSSSFVNFVAGTNFSKLSVVCVEFFVVCVITKVEIGLQNI